MEKDHWDKNWRNIKFMYLICFLIWTLLLGMKIYHSWPALLSFIVLNICCNEVSTQQSFPLYSVIAPSTLRPNTIYHVSVAIHDGEAAADFSVQIHGLNDKFVPVNLIKDVHVEPKQTQLVDFEIDNWRPGNYTLEIVGRGGLYIQNSTKLHFEHKSYSVFIQTDRPVYKPGQLVQFRAIVTDPFLNPRAGFFTADLLVKDAHNNSIEEWKNVQTINGVASANFRLSDGLVLGDWTIHVDVEGQKFHKAFTVAEFILPTYEVHIELPTYATYNKSDVVATVKAMYLYGKPVKGELTLTVAPRTRYNKLTVRPYESFQTKAKIDGTIEIYLNLLSDLSLRTDYFKREIEFFALIEEDETGHKYNSTNTMWIYDKEIKIDLIKTSETFKPGLKYTAFLKVVHQDGSQVSEGRNILELQYAYSIGEVEWKSALYTVPRNGLIELEFTPPNEESVTFLNMRALFQNQTFYLDRIEAAISPSNNFIQVYLLTPNPKALQIVEMAVNATEPLNRLVYQVFCRGNIEIGQTIPVPNQKTYRFSFRAPSSMAPRARVLVYYIRNTNHEVVADSVSFDVEGLFRTTVTISTNANDIQPGRKVNVRVQTKPNAVVGILGIDRGILDMKSGNDITQKDVIEDIETYDGGQSTKHRPPWYKRRRKRSLSWPGSKSAGLIFADSGSVIMTNALLSNAGNEDLFPENAIYLDENAANAPIQPPAELPGAIVDKGRLIIRKQFPETWLWINTTTGADGTASVTHSVPDDLTSYVISAFAINSADGLGISPATSEINVYRPFFITMSLPYAVLMGEDLAIQVVVFNYQKKSIQVEVTMENAKDEFDFTSAGKDTSDISNRDKRTKIVAVPPSEGVPVSFLIIPKKVGYIDIRVSSSTTLTSDSLTKKLLVQPEGSTQYFSKAFLVDLRNPSSVLRRNVTTVIPRNAIRDSGKITISVTGDLMGPSIKEMHKLLYMPTGCGEQNLATFVPRLIALRYLSSVNKLNPSIRNQAIASLKNGYQKQMTYKRTDGSFSSFGERDKSGSTWLTAYAISSLHMAQPHIFVDKDIIEKGLEWIIEKQSSDGSFEEPGEVHHKALQGGAENGAALTAFVLLSLFENRAQDLYGQNMIRAQRYIERELLTSTSPYVVAIVSYALHVLDSPSKDRAFQKLLSIAEKEEDEFLYWNNQENEVNITDKQSDYWFRAPSINIETAAYGILTFAYRFDVAEAVPALRWLIMKQNKNGGFSSTQDTVVALHAISQIAPLMTPPTTGINVKFSYPDSQKVLRISNSLNVEEIELPVNTPYVEIEASGSGIGIVQVSWSFNLAVSGEAPTFFLNALLDKTSTESYLQLSICTHQRERRDDTSNMAVMEVSLPSGYIADVDALPSILQIPKVKRVETQLQDTGVVIYFDTLDKEESCVTVPAHRIHKVARQRRAFVKVYDYYSQAKSARMFYRPHKTTLCDICDEDDCGEGCYEEEKTNESPLASFAVTVKFSYLLMVMLFVITRISYTVHNNR